MEPLLEGAMEEGHQVVTTGLLGVLMVLQGATMGLGEVGAHHHSSSRCRGTNRACMGHHKGVRVRMVVLVVVVVGPLVHSTIWAPVPWLVIGQHHVSSPSVR